MVPERWLVLTLRVPSDDVHDDLTEGLIALGGAAVIEEDDHLLTTYLKPPDDPDAYLKEVADRFDAMVGRSVEMVYRWEEDQDWAVKWKEGLVPRRVGTHIVVTPPWGEPELGPGDHLIVVEPAMAFGTGEHETTRGALRLLEPVVMDGAAVLDVGTGSGILAMAAARLGASTIHAVERDEDAVACCARNLEANGVAGRVRLECLTVDEVWLRSLGRRFDLVLANVLSRILLPLMGDLADRVAPGGYLILGGMLEEEAGGVIAAATAAGLELDAEDREGGWWSGRFMAPAD